jgi:hypothetical protein
MDPSMVLIIIGVTTLIVERSFSWALKIKKSNCCGNTIEMKDDYEEIRES